MESENVMNGNTRQARVDRLALECPVLLENDGTLPLKQVGKIALFGNGARGTVKGGTGSGDVKVKEVISVEEGLNRAGFTITTGNWLDRLDQVKGKAIMEYFAWADAKAKQENVPAFSIFLSYPPKETVTEPITAADIAGADTDTAIYVLARNSGEGADRTNEPWDYKLSEEERQNIRLLAERFDKLVVVLNIGGVMELGALHEIPGVNAILLMGQLGAGGGTVLADLLTGKATPSGKTVDTWAKSCEDYPSTPEFSNISGDFNETRYTEGIYVGYRYFDTFRKEPEYCFGYGLSYTRFEIKTLDAAVDRGDIVLKVSVKNMGGEYSGKEVIQVYGSSPSVELDQPYQELIGFCKTGEIGPGKSEEQELRIAFSAMASFSERESAWVLEPGVYVIRVGNSSRDTTPVLTIRLAERVMVQRTQKLFETAPGFAELTSAREMEEICDIPCAQIAPADIGTGSGDAAKTLALGEANAVRTDRVLTMEDIKYGVCTALDIARQLTVEELADLCVGTSRQDSEKSVIGNAAQTVPGAAGETSSILSRTRRIRPIIMADGPAGVRIMQECTAIPVGWSLAQSWNENAAEEAGKIVGEELLENGIDLWLAPALNIHRHPLCGRNFEYYSEDPLISGRMAAAVVNGVQGSSGKGVTIKHLAANNQEDNRYFVNVQVSERAMREIYLKGFEIAVKESAPMAIMTSYNLLNGIHTANHKNLLNVTRDEWGFDGIVMTDWFTSQDVPEITGKYTPAYPISSSVGCIYAGNDLQMPGCLKNVTDIIQAVRDGKVVDGYSITLEDLQACAARIIAVAAKFSKQNDKQMEEQ